MWLPRVTTPLRGGVLKFHNRKVVGLLAQWVTSFNNMNYHTWRKNLKQGPVLPTCRLCQEPLSEEGAWHLSTECDAAAALARLHLNIFTEDTTKWSWESLRAFILSPTSTAWLRPGRYHEPIRTSHPETLTKGIIWRPWSSPLPRIHQGGGRH